MAHLSLWTGPPPVAGLLYCPPRTAHRPWYTTSGNAYANAHLLPESTIAAFDAQDKLTNTHHSLDSSIYKTKDDILSLIPVDTVFYAFTHANAGVFTDSYCGGGFWPPCPDWQRITASEVAAQVANKGWYPPYNFVFVDGCQSASTTSLASAFGVVGPTGGALTDRAFVGWLTVSDSRDLPFTQTLWAWLAAGAELAQAYTEAKKTIYSGNYAFYWGDQHYRLATRYAGTGTGDYFQCFGGAP